jgi:hypothetical protein
VLIATAQATPRVGSLWSTDAFFEVAASLYGDFYLHSFSDNVTVAPIS